MEKIVIIEDREIKLRTHGNVPNLYEKQFGTDLFVEMQQMQGGEVKLSTFNNFLWLAAKVADPEILPPDEWFESFDSLPIMSALEEVQEMFDRLMSTGKKSTVPKKAKK